MSRKQACAGVIGNPRYPDAGRPCKRWAVNGSDFCGVHGGSNKNLLSDPSTLDNRCTAKSSKTGSQCKNNAIRGGTVCRFHGGSAKHVAKKARERLMEMVEPALVQLNRIMEQPSTSDSDRLRAIQMVLDRTGYTPGSRVEVEIKPWEQVMQSAFKRVGEGARMPEVIKTPPPELLALVARDGDDSDTLDAELVEDEEPDLLTPHVAPVVHLPRRGSANPPGR